MEMLAIYDQGRARNDITEGMNTEEVRTTYERLWHATIQQCPHHWEARHSEYLSFARGCNIMTGRSYKIDEKY